MPHRVIAALCVMVAPTMPGQARADKEQIQQAVNRGIACLKQLQAADGSWPTHHVGATALVGLTLLECDVQGTDPAVQAAAAHLRSVWTDINDGHTTYAISLTILFLDRLGDAADTVIIQALAARLLAGQSPAGGWSYGCPMLGAEDVRQLKKLLQHQVELKTGDKRSTLARRPSQDKPALPTEIRQILGRLQAQHPVSGRRGGLALSRDDNSNTQFAILGLWAARRHGLPVEKALARAERHFRTSQHPDGGWSYIAIGNAAAFGSSTPSMTCAGLLGLAMGYGSAREATLRTEAKATSSRASAAKASPDPAKDPVIRAGLRYLTGVVGEPLEDAGWRGPGPGMGDMYYLLWSIERVAVAYGLAAIGNKDWYAWGSRILLAAQGGDGGWRGRFGTDIDTSFALLFLRRANLTRDLTAFMKRAASVNVALKTSIPPVAKSEGLGDDRIGRADAEETADAHGRADTEPVPGKSAPRPEAEISENRADPAAKRPLEGNTKPAGVRDAKPASPSPATAAEQPGDEAGRLATELVKASGRQQEELLDQLKQGKGVAYTQALATAVPQLNGSIKNRAREALTERLARMTATTLQEKFQDESAEIRRAAALACAMKEQRQFIPDLITLLEDPKPIVARAAHAALKDLTGKDLGSPADAQPDARVHAVAAWRQWWKKQADQK